MTTFQPDPNSVDPQLQRLVRRCLDGTASAAEVEQARQAAGLSPLEAVLLAEAIERQTATFIGDVLQPIC